MILRCEEMKIDIDYIISQLNDLSSFEFVRMIQIVRWNLY